MSARDRRRALLAIALVAAIESPGSADAGAIAVGPGETLGVTVEGHGPAVVLVPGLLGSAFAYRNVVPRLANSGHSVVVVEPLGVGSSSRPPRADYSLTAQADRIARALDVLEITVADAIARAPADARTAVAGGGQ